MFLFNSDEQPDEKFDRFFTNIHLENERAVWLWCSSKLRPQWERVVKCPVAIAMGLAELEVGQSKDEDVVSLAVHPFGRSKLTLEDIKQARGDGVDALPRLKPMGVRQAILVVKTVKISGEKIRALDPLKKTKCDGPR
jgi:hypothetical protein